MSKLRLLDLFSGIGGFSLGLERSGGFETVAFCEIEDFPRRVLAKHWPKVPCYHDIRELTADRLAADGITVDAICGGFPCQDISVAGTKSGIRGNRSSLWFEYARLIGELRPRIVFVENSSELVGRGMDAVLGSLSEIGYDAEWNCIPAAAVGAPHLRNRAWLLAYPACQRCAEAGRDCARCAQQVAGRRAFLANALRSRCQERDYSTVAGEAVVWSNTSDFSQGWVHRNAPEPAVSGLADGFSKGLGEIRTAGNAVVPQIPELLGRAWMEANHV
jgi:DNA (cytosine-5)-methyltransferase 1